MKLVKKKKKNGKKMKRTAILEAFTKYKEYYLHSILMNGMDKGCFATWDQPVSKQEKTEHLY